MRAEGEAPPPAPGAGEPAGVTPGRVEIDISSAAIAKVLATLVVLALLARTWQVLVWIAISLMFVATFNPFVRRLQTHINRPRAITAVVLAAVAVLSGL